jgi:hypothetical protein
VGVGDGVGDGVGVGAAGLALFSAERGPVPMALIAATW